MKAVKIMSSNLEVLLCDALWQLVLATYNVVHWNGGNRRPLEQVRYIKKQYNRWCQAVRFQYQSKGRVINVESNESISSTHVMLMKQQYVTVAVNCMSTVGYVRMQDCSNRMLPRQLWLQNTVTVAMQCMSMKLCLCLLLSN